MDNGAKKVSCKNKDCVVLVTILNISGDILRKLILNRERQKKRKKYKEEK